MLCDFRALVRKDYYTEENNNKLLEIQHTKEAIMSALCAEHNLTEKDCKLLEVEFKLYKKSSRTNIAEWKEDLFEKWIDLDNQVEAVYLEARERYKEARTEDGILEDVIAIVNLFEKEDYLLQVESMRKLSETEQYKKLTEKGVSTALDKIFDKYAYESYELCFAYCFDLVSEPILELLENKAKQYLAIQEVKKRVALWYEEPEEIEELEPDFATLPKYDFVYPTEYQQNLTKASKKIFDSAIALSDLRQAEIDVTPNKKGGLTSFSVYVDMSAPELKGTENVTEYDKSVHNMAISIGLANKHGFFTARELATALIHGDNPNNNRVSSQQIGAVTKSIEKQRHIDITIDWTEHIKLNNKGNLPEDASNFTVKDYMLPVREYTATIGGKTLHGYQFIDPVKLSPLYQYACSVGQIGQHPVKMLNIPINLDQQKLVLRDYLLEQIAHFKNPRNRLSRTISVEKLLEVAGEDVATISRKKKSALLQAVENMLTYWKEEGYIKDYQRNRAKTTGSPLQSFTIITE